MCPRPSQTESQERADTLADERKSQQLAPTDIKLNRAETINIPDFSPTPDLPVEVHIKTSERTLFQYIVKPIRDSMMRAFRTIGKKKWLGENKSDERRMEPLMMRARLPCVSKS
jgi:hypothetical protein